MANLFVPKMFVNDLWAAGQQVQHRKRGHPLLTAWWLAVLVAFGSSGAVLGRVHQTAHADQAQEMWQVMQGNGLFIVVAGGTITVVWRLNGMLERAVRSAVEDVPEAASHLPAR